MVAAPDNRDLSNKEKERTHTYSTERKKNDGQIKKTAKRNQKLKNVIHLITEWKKLTTVYNSPQSLEKMKCIWEFSKSL